MFLFWFRKISQQNGVRLETGKPCRRFYKEAGKKRVHKWKTSVEGWMGVSLGNYHRAGLQCRELSGLGDWWLLRGRERMAGLWCDRGLFSWYYCILWGSSTQRAFPAPERYQNVSQCIDCIKKPYDRNEFSKICTAGSFMDIKSMAVYEKRQCFSQLSVLGYAASSLYICRDNVA